MLEREIQKKFIELLKKHNIMYVKHQAGLRSLKQKDGTMKSYMGTNYMPDLELYFPQGKVLFVEIKRNKGQLSEKQYYKMVELEDLGHHTFIITEKDLFRIKNWIEGCLEVNGRVNYEKAITDFSIYFEHYGNICGIKKEYK